MIILPTTTPVVAADFSNLNQTHQNQTNQAEQSKRASDTVMLSSEARQMASADLNYKPSTTAEPVAPPQVDSANAPATAEQAPAASTPVSVPQAADNEASEKVADSEAAEQQRPVNAMTGKFESTKIDMLA
ncbi:MAG: hypothetical protein AUJ57_00005 [Zetaproteobacteria bacterium CG1_02_53_45]|nr:MAG: hypothetical protein AUJ57_00005 [Zetaproteobacteria bacterium CG1_02_53_45]